MKQLAVITALFILFSSFRSDTTVKVDLYNSQWQLKAIHNKEGIAYIYTNAFIRFDEEKKRVGGNGSCNSFGGSVEVNDSHLRFGHLISTRMYCERVQEIETDYFAALSKVNRFEIKGNILLMYQGGQLLLEFEGYQ